MIDHATARELAQHVANAESKNLNAAESYVIVDERVHEEPWGWAFELAVEPPRSSAHPCPQEEARCVTVDRFSGKTQLSTSVGWRADRGPVIELLLTDLGDDPTAVYAFLRPFNGGTNTEVEERMRALPIVVAAGSKTTVSAIAAALAGRGATVELRQQQAE